MTEAMCENCRFFKPDTTNMQNGFCRLKPPVCFPMMTQQGQVAWSANFPPVMRSSWCGEYKPVLN